MSRASPITPATIAIRHGCPAATAWCSAPIAIAAPGRSDLYQLWLADGRVERLTVFFHGNAIMPNVSPDGGWVAFAAQTLPVDFGWTYQIHVLEIATRMTWPFDESGPACWPNWSPDGQSIAHVSLLREPSNIQTLNSFGTSPQPITGDPSRWHYYPDWSPDSRLLAASVSPEHHDGEDWDLAIVDPSRALPVAAPDHRRRQRSPARLEATLNPGAGIRESAAVIHRFPAFPVPGVYRYH